VRDQTFINLTLEPVFCLLNSLEVLIISRDFLRADFIWPVYEGTMLLNYSVVSLCAVTSVTDYS